MTQYVFDAVSQHARVSPGRIALDDGQRRISYAMLATFLDATGEALAGDSKVLGIACSDPLDAALADLALSYHGHTVVHLPPFFSEAQIAHVVTAAGIKGVVGASFPGVENLTLAAPDAAPPLKVRLAPAKAGGRRIIFTSGSSGQPKGVVIAEKQTAAALNGLERAIEPDPADVHLSLLPMAQLLEQIAGLYLPLCAGAQVRFCAQALPALFGGPMEPVLDAFETSHPTTTILVPAFLSRLVAALRETGKKAPESLRFVAVGGAGSAPALLTEAMSVGLPVYEGYGLSECCSVVAMNRPGDMRPGTVGQCLEGIDVRIENGEIVVSGPTVMEGYLGQPSVTGDWHTGDLGRIEDGRLIVAGRKDWLIVTPEGRNISPEWVEACLGADPRIPASGLCLASDGQLEIIAALAAKVDRGEVAKRLADLPVYARPARVIFVPASLPGLLKPGGGIDRSQLAEISRNWPAAPLSYDIKECVA
ncbi:AMP-binding protein [Shimia sp. FJ5]|uniref:AMP-binding protein n=1 Tax=Shimia sp. FJ5 TaxID=3079054 RepID=UPI0026069AA0|nr:AMP-binding protein [Shimia sp. FJ5]MDV4146120.1 AMP-binding protein [Shimia sp. FJ5]